MADVLSEAEADHCTVKRDTSLVLMSTRRRPWTRGRTSATLRSITQTVGRTSIAAAGLHWRSLTSPRLARYPV